MDYSTIRTSISRGYLLVYAAMIVFFAYANGPGMSLGIGLMLAVMFLSHPFAIGEKNNLDALYTTLSLDRKTVVAGRYFFLLVLNMCAFLAVFALTAITMFVKGEAPLGEILSEMLAVATVVVAMSFVVQALQLPLYFKLGYEKGKIVSLIPLFVMFGALIGFNLLTTYFESDFTQHITQLVQLMNTPVFIVLAGLSVIAVVFVSYKLSVAFYKKREF